MIGNPPFNRLNAQTVAEGLQFVLSATKLSLTNEPGTDFDRNSVPMNVNPTHSATAPFEESCEQRRVFMKN